MTFFIHSAFSEDASKAAAAPAKRKKKADVKEVVIKTLATEPMASQELAVIAGYSTHRSGAYLRIINELVTEGKIAFTNPENLRDKNQKLYLVQGAT